MGEGDTLVNAILGAAVTVLLSFTAVSPFLGGGAAGYLQRGERADGARVGALSGLIAAIPFALFFVAIVGFFFAFPFGAGPGMGMMDSPRLFSVLFVFVILAGIIWTVLLSAVGGYLGVYLATETDVGGEDRTESYQ